MSRFLAFLLLSFALLPALTQQPATAPIPTPSEGDFTLRDFHFESGEMVPELKIHYYTLGKLAKDADGKASNAVLLLHGTGGTGKSFLRPQFAGVLFGPGQLLDINRYFIVLPDNIGHGKSSKPSDGMHAHFPHYDYEDMVLAQHELLDKGLGVNHLRLILGTSMGCMHSWVWGETYPGFMDTLMPLACLPVEIAGRNRMWRDMVIQGIQQDHVWRNGDYRTQPHMGLQIAADLWMIAAGSPLLLQKEAPTRDAADNYVEDYTKRMRASLDANDVLYALSSSRNYDPSQYLDKITARVMFINSADDFINPPELGIAEREIKKVRNGRFVLLPISDQTHGHGSHTYAALWQQYLKELLGEQH
jgi:homoserine O-acetyltransferase